MARHERYRQIPRSSPLTSAPRYWKRPKGQAARLRTEPPAVVRGHVVELGGDHSPTFEATVAGVIGAADMASAAARTARDDVVVASAAAEVALQALPDRGGLRPWLSTPRRPKSTRPAPACGCKRMSTRRIRQRLPVPGNDRFSDRRAGSSILRSCRRLSPQREHPRHG